ncbi:MBOAT family O-acyltransferase [Maridesulfovibrio frigidus]|uniref:MBOAT family O-acyltransferase n=1 Tax=Maridesulfovibrio frigidus TaxID=340956 RepID=UPI000A9D8FFF|nr:MBOAT family O-acyltransferase [Maridesulfovibrio frigidus]
MIQTTNQVLDSNISTLNTILPLAISFFTFQQIAYLQDCDKGKVEGTGFVDYLLFISFFPQLIAGPIVQFKEIVPQFHSKTFHFLNWENMSAGLMLIGFGLAKKVLLADYFSIWANYGYGEVQSLTFLKAWITSLSYSLQLYFDFSGYTDMALGAALLFGITLPQNFNSPYKSLSIQAFWRRWHITLGRFLRDYMYIPLGGNRDGHIRTCLNLIFVFLVAGLWHGAGWTFVIWGGLHGVALVVHRIWVARNITMPNFVAWTITFMFVNFAWVLFRAETLADAISVTKAMLTPDIIFNKGYIVPLSTVLLGLLLCVFGKNSDYFIEKSANTRPIAITIASLAAFAGLVTIKIWNANEFLYFQF